MDFDERARGTMNAGQNDVGADPDGKEKPKRGIVAPLLLGNEDAQRHDAKQQLSIAESVKK
jgi:hypothetical protein